MFLKLIAPPNILFKLYKLTSYFAIANQAPSPNAVFFQSIVIAPTATVYTLRHIGEECKIFNLK
jgi:hypothetical protein